MPLCSPIYGGMKVRRSLYSRERFRVFARCRGPDVDDDFTHVAFSHPGFALDAQLLLLHVMKVSSSKSALNQLRVWLFIGLLLGIRDESERMAVFTGRF